MDFLTKIVAQKKEEIAAAQKRLPESQLREEAFLPRKRRPFMKRLEQPGTNIIAEIKRASPSKGSLCPNLDPAAYAAAYQKGGAAALSVLTDQPHFQGSFEDFKTARKATTLPSLRKDFLISSYQLYESAVLGADAVLLIVRILSQEQLRIISNFPKTLSWMPWLKCILKKNSNPLPAQVLHSSESTTGTCVPLRPTLKQR